MKPSLPLRLDAPRSRLPLVSGDGAFTRHLAEHGAKPLVRGTVRTLQVNVGKLCNMACLHCHVEAGPKRREIMSHEVASRVVELLRANPEVEALDLTGGAPELNPSFRYLVAEARALGRRVLDRCNLTVLFEPEAATLPAFLAEHQVEIVASLPCYGPANVDEQRGAGAFDASIRALQLLNGLGYGRGGSPLQLDLVYNAVGASLPPPQASLEVRYKEELRARFGIEFHRLLTITNMPIARFARALEHGPGAGAYLGLLMQHFNAATVDGLMCKSLVSVGWDGRLYDCDFNQMTDLPLGGGGPRLPRTVFDVERLHTLEGASVATASHCFGCTAGAGSSCSGALR